MRCVNQLSEEQIEQLHRLYQKEWWTKGRELNDVRRMLVHSDEIVAIVDDDSDELLGFSRVITDYVFKALILDVIVKKSRRGGGVGRKIMAEILRHSSLQNVEHFELYCLPDVVSFYEQWNFSDQLGALRLMRRGD